MEHPLVSVAKLTSDISPQLMVKILAKRVAMHIAGGGCSLVVVERSHSSYPVKALKDHELRGAK